MALVSVGRCWWYRKYAPDNFELESLEKDAREAKKGLRADEHPYHHGRGDGVQDVQLLNEDGVAEEFEARMALSVLFDP